MATTTNTLYGVLLQQGSAFVCTLGLVLQKVSAERAEKQAAGFAPKSSSKQAPTFYAPGGITNTTTSPGATSAATSPSKPKPVYQQPLWVFGFSCFLLGQLLMPAALALAPQSVLSCLAPSALVANSVLTPCLLGEQLQRFHYYSVLLIFAGCIVSVLYGLQEEEDANTEVVFDLKHFYYLLTRPLFHVLFAGTVVVTIILGRPILRQLCAPSRSRTKSAEAAAATFSKDSTVAGASTSGAFLSTGFTDTKNDDPLAYPPSGGASSPGKNSSKIAATSSPFALILLSSIFGAISVSSTKVVSTLVATELSAATRTTEDSSMGSGTSGSSTSSSASFLLTLVHWLFLSPAGRTSLLLILFGILCMAFCSISLLNLSMLRFSSLTTVTLSTGLGLICQFLYGAIFFEEYRFFTRASFFGTVLGILLNFAGLSCLLLAPAVQLDVKASGKDKKTDNVLYQPVSTFADDGRGQDEREHGVDTLFEGRSFFQDEAGTTTTTTNRELSSFVDHAKHAAKASSRAGAGGQSNRRMPTSSPILVNTEGEELYQMEPEVSSPV